MSPNPKTELAFIKIYDSWKVQSARFRKRTPFCRYMAEALEAGEIPGYPGEMERVPTRPISDGVFRLVLKEATE